MKDNFWPHPKQVKVLVESKRFCIMCSGVRSGKTAVGARLFRDRIARDRKEKYPDQSRQLRYWLVAPTFQLGRVQLREFVDALGGWKSPLIIDYSKTDKEFTLIGNIIVQCKTADNPLNLVAEGLYGVWIDEVARVDQEAWTGGLRMRLTDHEGWAIFTTTPLGRNWVYYDLVQKATVYTNSAGTYIPPNPDYSYHTWHTVDNPYVSSIEVAKAKAELPESYYRREYEASFDSFFGQVYPEFDRSIHITNSKPSNVVETRYGIDWGYRHSGCILVAQRDDKDVWWIVEEVCKEGVLKTGEGESWLKIAKSLYIKYGKQGKFFADSADQEAIEQFRRAGLPIYNADKNVLAGIEHIAKLLHVNPVSGTHLKVCNNCTKLIEQFGTYTWKDNTHKEEVNKENDDAIDALRYILYRKPTQAHLY